MHKSRSCCSCCCWCEYSLGDKTPPHCVGFRFCCNACNRWWEHETLTDVERRNSFSICLTLFEECRHQLRIRSQNVEYLLLQVRMLWNRNSRDPVRRSDCWGPSFPLERRPAACWSCRLASRSRCPSSITSAPAGHCVRHSGQRCLGAATAQIAVALRLRHQMLLLRQLCLMFFCPRTERLTSWQCLAW